MKAMIIDINGVLTDIEEYHYLAWKLVVSNLGIMLDRQLKREIQGLSSMAALELILDQKGHGNTLSQMDRLRLVAKKKHRYTEMIQQLKDKRISKDVRLALEQAQNKGIKICLASTLEDAENVIDLLGFKQQISLVLDASQVSRQSEKEIKSFCAKGLGIEEKECQGIYKNLREVKKDL